MFAAAVVATALAAGAAQAQDGRSMEAGLSLLQSSAGRLFAQLGIDDVDPMDLTLNQLARVNAALGSSAGNSVRTRIRVETILREQ
jgi:hypothetical protein